MQLEYVYAFCVSLYSIALLQEALLYAVVVANAFMNITLSLNLHN